MVLKTFTNGSRYRSESYFIAMYFQTDVWSGDFQADVWAKRLTTVHQGMFYNHFGTNMKP